MSKFKDIDQLTISDIESFFESGIPTNYDFVLAASRSKLPKALVSKHTYVGAINTDQLVMWAKRNTITKTLADLSCSIDLDELVIEDTWSKKNVKGCELLFPDGQKVIIESTGDDTKFVEALVDAIVNATTNANSTNENDVIHTGEAIFAEPGVARTDTHALESQTLPRPETQPETNLASAKEQSKTPVVTRDVIIESLRRAQEGIISVKAIKQWALKVRDCTIIDADEAMVSYILFSLSRIDTENENEAKAAINQYYERLTVTLV